MKRKKKKYSRPRKPFDKPRIDAENELIQAYGLKNKKEIWKAGASIDRIRNQAKKLITASPEEQEVLFNKLRKMGFKIKSTADVLDLNGEDWLKRRLQSLVISKLKVKPREARQMISHKHVAIEGKVINVPSYIVRVDEEDKIQYFRKVKKPVEKASKEVKDAPKKEEVKEKTGEKK